MAIIIIIVLIAIIAEDQEQLGFCRIKGILFFRLWLRNVPVVVGSKTALKK